MMLLCHNVFSQKGSNDHHQVKFNEVESIVPIDNIIDSLRRYELSCEEYNDSLYWTAEVMKHADVYRIRITIVSDLGTLVELEEGNIFGIYTRSDKPVIVLGKSACEIFNFSGEKVQLKYSARPDVEVFEDYDLWVYMVNLKSAKLELMEEYTLPCGE